MAVIRPLKFSANIVQQCEDGTDTIDPQLTTPGVNAQTGTAYTLAETDNGSFVTVNNSAANSVTIPANSTVALPVGFCVAVLQLGAGATSVSPASGVTLNGGTSAIACSAQYGAIGIVQVAADAWVASVGEP